MFFVFDKIESSLRLESFFLLPIFNWHLFNNGVQVAILNNWVDHISLIETLVWLDFIIGVYQLFKNIY